MDQDDFAFLEGPLRGRDYAEHGVPGRTNIRPPEVAPSVPDAAFAPSPLERDLLDDAEDEAEAAPAVRAPVRAQAKPFARSPSNPSGKQAHDAKPLDLSTKAESPSAIALCDVAMGIVLAWEAATKLRKKRRSATEAAVLRRALEAFVGGLLRAWGGRKRTMAYRSTNQDSFTGSRVPARQFKFLIESMDETNLIGRSRQFRRGHDPGGWLASRFWPMQRLLDLAEAAGVSPASVRQDFRPDSTHQDWKQPPHVTRPIRLVYGGKADGFGKGKKWFDAARPEALALRNEVLEHNAFAAQFEVEGCTPPRWHRVFHEDWRLGGRWYSLGPSGWHYQSMAEAKRIEVIRINGERVAEIDIKACLLVLAHGVLGVPLPEGDPYHVADDLHRPAIKRFINATLGKGSPLARWPDDCREEMAALGYSTPELVGGPVLARYPFIANGLHRIAGADFLPRAVSRLPARSTSPR
jgi:hypothetical protein